MAKSIVLKDYTHIRNEGIAAAALLPGLFVTLDSNAKYAKAATVFTGVVFEDELQGKTITDAIASADPVQVWTPGPGCEAQIQAKAATYAVGNAIEVTTGGIGQKLASGTAVAVVIEGVVLASQGLLKVVFI